jgi:3-oxoacyl-[acyl-carrier-protein] synthase II
MGEPDVSAVEVVLSGVGLVTPAGVGVEPLIEALRHGRTFISGHDDEVWPSARVAEEHIFWPPGPRWTDLRKYTARAGPLAVTAARQALTTCTDNAAEKSGVVLAMESDGTEWAELAQILARREDKRPVARQIFEDLADFHVLRTVPSGVAQMVALCGSFEGGATTVPRPGLGGLLALSMAIRLVESGELDLVVVAGTEPLVTPFVQSAVNATDPVATRVEAASFDRRRAGTFFGEAGVALLIESSTATRQRGATPLARLWACETRAGASCAEALARAVDATVARGGRAPDAIVAHGTGSRVGDAVEAAVLSPRFAAPVTATTGCIGNTNACAGLVNLALALACLRAQELPPVPLLSEVDPELPPLQLVVGAPRPIPGARTALVTTVPEQPVGLGAAAMLELVADASGA